MKFTYKIKVPGNWFPPGMVDWLLVNIGAPYEKWVTVPRMQIGPNQVAFTTEEDAMWFALRWA